MCVCVCVVAVLTGKTQPALKSCEVMQWVKSDEMFLELHISSAKVHTSIAVLKLLTHFYLMQPL